MYLCPNYHYLGVADKHLHDSKRTDEHAHFVTTGVREPDIDLIALGHGGIAVRAYGYRGDWYAVHTH